MMGLSKAVRDAEFSAFVARDQRSLTKTAWLLTGNAEAAAELVQAALVKTYVAWPRVRTTTAASRTATRRRGCWPPCPPGSGR